MLYVFACKKAKCQLSSSGWCCIRQQKVVEEEEEVKTEKPQPKSSPGLSWDFGGSASSSLFGGSLSGNANLMDLLNKMEKKEKVVEEQPEAQEKQITVPVGIPVTSPNHPTLPEFFLDVIKHCSCQT